MLESLIGFVVPTLAILGAILMIIGYVLYKYVADRIVHIGGLILLLIGLVVLIVGIIEYL